VHLRKSESADRLREVSTRDLPQPSAALDQSLAAAGSGVSGRRLPGATAGRLLNAAAAWSGAGRIESGILGAPPSAYRRLSSTSGLLLS